jgi:aspartyl-tRNA(Asn)/glutamyl-tRNA(Gln) amidotransferase subunit C
MALTIEQVQHVARLARLRLAPDELEKMREQLSNILDHFQMLQELDVSGVPATAQVTELQSVTRPDELRPSLPREAALGNAPDQQDGMFRVRAIFEE